MFEPLSASKKRVVYMNQQTPTKHTLVTQNEILDFDNEEESKSNETLRESMHLATLNENSPPLVKEITVQEAVIIDKIAKLDEVSQILRELKAKFVNQGQITKEEVQEIINNDYEQMLSNLKQDYML